MFKRGVITDEISQDFKEAVGLAAKYGLDGVEIRSVWEKGPHELTRQDIRRIKDILLEYGMETCAISAPFFKCHINDKEAVEEHIDILKKCIALAQELETDKVRGFTFWKEGDFDQYLSQIIDRFEKPVQILKDEDIILALEFDPSVFASNAQKLVKVIEGINSPNVRGLWDPGNDIYDPEGEVPYPDGYRIIKPHMVHMHLKDARIFENGKIIGVPIGEGQVGYIEHFKALLEDDYDGYVVLETHYRPKHDISEDLLALPKGSAFSYLGYEATEECLIKWKNILDQI
jgi:L-ribulose-5-phosphate 3-epimerase